MPSSTTLTDKQQVSAGVSILDADGQAFTEKPDGVTVAFVSDTPEVADFTIGPDGLNGTVTSGKVGTAIITASVSLPDGTTMTDTLAVAVQNSLPGSVNFTVGTPIDE